MFFKTKRHNEGQSLIIYAVLQNFAQTSYNYCKITHTLGRSCQVSEDLVKLVRVILL